jgi:hypothetical protein
MNVRPALMSVLCVSAFLAAATPATADDNRFAVATITNRTGDVTMRTLEYRWGENGQWRRVEKDFRPGRSEYFWAELDGNGNAPQLYVRFNEAIGGVIRFDREYKLKTNAAPDKLAKFGHQYEFRRDTNDRDYVSFYDDQAN